MSASFHIKGKLLHFTFHFAFICFVTITFGICWTKYHKVVFWIEFIDNVAQKLPKGVWGEDVGASLQIWWSLCLNTNTVLVNCPKLHTRSWVWRGETCNENVEMRAVQFTKVCQLVMDPHTFYFKKLLVDHRHGVLKSLCEITSSFFSTLAKEHGIKMMMAIHEMPSLRLLKEQHFVIWTVIETEIDPLTVQSIHNFLGQEESECFLRFFIIIF